MPRSWKESRVKYWTRINPEVLTEDYNEGAEIEYVDIGNVDQIRGIASTERMYFSEAPSRARRRVRDGDTIVSTVRTYLKAVAPIKNPPPNLIVSTGFAVLRPGPKADPSFLSWFCQSQELVEKIVANSTGVSYPAINPSVLGGLPVRFPALDHQRKIADFLDRETALIDELITKKERLFELIEDQRTTSISAAVLGATGTSPMQTWKKGPWPVLPLKRLTRKIIDGTHLTPTYVDEGTPFLRVSDIHGGQVDFDTVKRIPEAEHEELYKRCNPKRGDLLLSKNGTIGVPCVVKWDFPVSLFVSLCLIKPITTLVDPEYLFYLFDSHLIKAQLVERGKTNTVTNLHLEEIKELLVPVPPLARQLLFIQECEKLDAHASLIRKKLWLAIEKFHEYRTALISAAVTGQIDVRTYRKEPQAVLVPSA
jgi:type I restriction enzyme S subunit